MNLFSHDQVIAEPMSRQIEVRRLFGLFRLVCEGEEIPRGYGIAWRDTQSFRAWTCPVPLHLVVGALRWLWWEIRRGHPNALEMAVRAEVYRQMEVMRRELLLARARCAELEEALRRSGCTWWNTRNWNTP